MVTDVVWAKSSLIGVFRDYDSSTESATYTQNTAEQCCPHQKSNSTQILIKTPTRIIACIPLRYSSGCDNNVGGGKHKKYARDSPQGAILTRGAITKVAGAWIFSHKQNI